jgi:hypothetical protein
MMIRLRQGPRDIRPVDVRASECPGLACFQMGRHTIRSAAGYSGCSSRSTDEWECATRERAGCPPEDSPARRVRVPAVYRRSRGVWAALAETP